MLRLVFYGTDKSKVEKEHFTMCTAVQYSPIELDRDYVDVSGISEDNVVPGIFGFYISIGGDDDHNIITRHIEVK